MDLFEKKKQRSPLRVALIYLLFGCLWILISDHLLHFFIKDLETIEQWQTSKGILFITLSALLIYFVTRSEYTRRVRVEDRLIETESKAKERAVKAGEEERNRISSELHDGIQQELAGISLMAERLKEDRDPREMAESIKGALTGCIQEVRSISHNIGSYHVEQLGLKTALERIPPQNKKGEFTEAELHLDLLDTHQFSYFIAINLYRITQELILNLSKHSDADRIELRIEREERDSFSYYYKDNGTHTKFDEDSGFGGYSIWKRIQGMGGQIIPKRGNCLKFIFQDRVLEKIENRTLVEGNV